MYPTQGVTVYIMQVRSALARENVPASFTGLPVVPPRYRAASDHLPNYIGLLINRMAPVPPVLAYDEDRVVDLALAVGEGTGHEPRNDLDA